MKTGWGCIFLQSDAEEVFITLDSFLTETAISANEELVASRRELVRLSAVLASLEMEWTELRIDLSHFELRYFRAVASRYAELDELRAQLAEKRASRFLDDPELMQAAIQARRKSEQSQEEFQRVDSGREEMPPKAPIPEEAKKLYRKIAAKIHPDKAHDDAMREVMTRLMAELNDAYVNGDISRMKDILNRWEESPEVVVGLGVQAELERLRRIIIQVKSRISEISKKIAGTKGTELFILMAKVRLAEAEGVDLLRRLVEEIEAEIRLARWALAEWE